MVREYRKSRRFFCFLLIIVLCTASLSLFAGCSPDAGTIVVGYFGDNNPLSATNPNGSATGFDVLLAAAVLDRLEIQYTFKEIKSTNAERMLFAGEVDLIWGGFPFSEELSDRFISSAEYLENTFVPIVRKDSGFGSDSDLTEYSVVALPSGSNALAEIAESERFSSRFSKSEDTYTAKSGAYLTATNHETLSGVKQAYYAMAICDTVSFRYLSSLPEFENVFKTLDGVYYKESYSVLAKKGAEELIGSIDGMLSSLYSSGYLQNLATQYDILSQIIEL